AGTSTLSTLNAVTLDGTLDMSSNFAPQVYVTNGMTLNGTIQLGSADGTVTAFLTFSGTQALSGTGSIIFGGALNNDLAISNDSAILTVGAGITIDGQSGMFTGGEIITQGTIAADAAGMPQGGSPAAIRLSTDEGLANSGTLAASNGETLTLFHY